MNTALNNNGRINRNGFFSILQPMGSLGTIKESINKTLFNKLPSALETSPLLLSLYIKFS